MWICLNDAFVSIVEDRDDSNYLICRARVKGHLEKVFSQTVKETPEGDYRYRVRVPRGDVANIMLGRVMNIRYDNFKNSVKDDNLHGAYLDFWVVMRRLQEKLMPKKAPLKIASGPRSNANTGKFGKVFTKK